MARRTKWLTVAVVVWASFWGTMFFISRDAFRDADRGFWRARSEGNEAVALMYHDAQVLARDWAHFSIAAGLVIPLVLFATPLVWRWFRAPSRNVE